MVSQLHFKNLREVTQAKPRRWACSSGSSNKSHLTDSPGEGEISSNPPLLGELEQTVSLILQTLAGSKSLPVFVILTVGGGATKSAGETSTIKLNFEKK